jgi:NhaA family Na+:H+ antiporter
MLKSGLHPTLAGVILGLMTPARAWIRPQILVGVVARGLESLKEPEAERDELDRDALHDLAFVATESISPLERLEHALHPWVAFAIMPIFALANAGVAISVEGLQDPLALAIIVALVIGKPVGIAGVSWLVIRMRLARLPERTSWPALVGAACLGGIGFTMALFIASLSVGEAELEGVKAGVLGGSAVSLLLGLGLLRWAIGRTPPAERSA